ncbi:unnamed protein product [Anisakis simplex]|uniref:Uncharacterized protein n=1 Tax=Anisakis simplex TaxID=6269 RepID=A0A0M3J1C0_ANISI|nr:unnamed protein product [Anisakis simplex]
MVESSHLLMLADMATLGAEISSRDESNAVTETNHAEWPQSANFPDSGHDYIRSSDFDLLVNSYHDYYDRIMAPEYDAEHSYAFNIASDSIYPKGVRSLSFSRLFVHSSLVNVNLHLWIKMD